MKKNKNKNKNKKFDLQNKVKKKKTKLLISFAFNLEVYCQTICWFLAAFIFVRFCVIAFKFAVFVFVIVNLFV